MRVWACKVVSGEFVRGQLHASHCLHRMGGMGALQQIQTLDSCMRLIVYTGWGNGRSRHWIKTQNAITFPALSILINVTMNLHPNGPSSAYKSSTSLDPPSPLLVPPINQI